ncbi:Asp-tRNA(Asn)/Glu-tRNA(Gln) amidotransferase subunit GatC [Cytophagaceae bacterium ABcell3]|nr:Asp-tRNA(Asn)/Glu-tRNA(Gln) amidotransferase subunit GatC [Cytophagaceae bacterium ABcell3]
MKINIETIRKIAHLSRLELNEKEEESFFNDFNKILDWMDKLNQVDTENVEPLIHMSEEVNVLREDNAVNALSHEEGLKNAPKKDSDYFRVPKFLGME